MSATTLTQQPETRTLRLKQKRIETQRPAKHNDDVVARSKERIRLHPHFRSSEPMLEYEVQQNRLVISGRLPSYFYKQLVQEAIRDIDSFEIDNRIIVTAEF